MNKIKRIAFALATAFPLSLFAADFPWLTFKLVDNTEMSVESEELSMTYQDGFLNLSSSKVDKSIPVSQIKSMMFTSTPTGVSDIKTADSQEGDYYNLSGIKVGRFLTVEEAKKSLPSGIYIVKSDSKTFKVTL